MNMEFLQGVLSAGMADMLRVLLTAVGVAAAGCLIWAASSRFKKKRKPGPPSPKDESDRDGPRPR